MNEIFRQTGRTTRMLEKAIRLTQESKSVYILVGTQKESKFLRMKFQALCDHLGIAKVKQDKVIIDYLHHLVEQNLDWETLEFTRGGYRDWELLMDHTLIEGRIKELQGQIKYRMQRIAELYPKTF